MDNTAKHGPGAESVGGTVRVCRMYAGCTGAGLRIFARQRVYARACFPWPWSAGGSAGSLRGRSERKGF